MSIQNFSPFTQQGNLTQSPDTAASFSILTVFLSFKVFCSVCMYMWLFHYFLHYEIRVSVCFCSSTYSQYAQYLWQLSLFISHSQYFDLDNYIFSVLHRVMRVQLLKVSPSTQTQMKKNTAETNSKHHTKWWNFRGILKDKVRRLSVTIIIQHSSGGSGWCSTPRKWKNKRYIDWKRQNF